MANEVVRIHLLSGGKMPERKTEGAIGFDVAIRAVVSPTEMDPEESVLVGIGFITEMEWPMFYWVAPRSGLAAKWGITVTNAPGTVDPDYRGEAGVLVYNRNPHQFLLHKNMRIAQVIFQRAIIPNLEEILTYQELTNTGRGTGGFGSTGIK